MVSTNILLIIYLTLTYDKHDRAALHLLESYYSMTTMAMMMAMMMRRRKW